MTTERDYRDFLLDLVKACRSIIGFVEGMSFATFMEDKKTRFAVVRGYEIMGEAMRHLPSEIKDADPDIPWGRMRQSETGSHMAILASTPSCCLKRSRQDRSRCCPSSGNWRGHME